MRAAETAVTRHHADIARRKTARAQRAISRIGKQDAANIEARILLQLRLGHARRLEIELIEHRVFGLRHRRRRTHRAARPVRHAQRDHAPEPVRPQQRGVPRDRSAPVMAGDHRLLLAQSIEQTYHVADQVQQRVLVDCIRRDRSAHSHACRGPPRGTPPRPEREADGARSTRTPESRGTTAQAAPCPARPRACECRLSRQSDASARSRHNPPGCSAAHRGIHHEGTKTQRRRWRAFAHHDGGVRR